MTQKPLGTGTTQKANAAGLPTAIAPDELLASDFGTACHPANVFRFRVDKNDVVIDFGYLPPLLAHEISELQAGSVPVHARITVPFGLARQLAEQLQKTIREAEKL
jgi:hypothetical protein